MKLTSLPNIVYLHSHDTGRYVQPYGHAVSTPNIQRLADEGVLFRQAFCAAPTCSPSRAALLTGQCPHSNGMLGLTHRNFGLTDYSRHLVHTLRKAGYYSALAGLQHVANDPQVIGFDAVLAPAEQPAAGAELRARAFIEQEAAAIAADKKAAQTSARGPAPAPGAAAPAPRRPFFLDVGFSETHRVSGGGFHRDGPRGDGRYARPPSCLPDNSSTRADMADYGVCAAELDAKYGVVIDTLRRTGLLENTLVLCTTDHGLPMPHMKCYCTDHGMGVLMILRGPGGFAGGKVIDAMVSQIDLFPTFCGLLGLDKPAWLEGKSLLPLIDPQPPVAEINDEIFAEVTYHTCYEPLRAVRTQRWKYIRRFDDRATPVVPNSDGGPTRQYLVDRDWQRQPVAREQLYDLLFDPGESSNLAMIPNLSQRIDPVLSEMRQRLERWMQRTNDPLLNGPIYIQGAIVNDPDDLSPNAPRKPLP